jgi:hypothetical protein
MLARAGYCCNMADISVLEQYVSRPVWATAVAAGLLVGLVHGHPFQGLLMPLSKFGGAALVAVIGGALLGGVYYVARRSEDADAQAAQFAKMDRMALSVAYSLKPPPKDNPRDDALGAMYHVIALSSVLCSPKTCANRCKRALLSLMARLRISRTCATAARSAV